MRSDLLDYDLPPHLIAQQPCAERDQARLLLVRRSAASIAHYHFHELPELLSRAPEDLAQGRAFERGRPYFYPLPP